MIKFKTFIPTLAAAALLLGGSTVHAGPVAFNISAASIIPDRAGYGTDTGKKPENGGTLLGVQFTDAFVPLIFTLGKVGDSVTFNLGTVTFNEPDTGDGGNEGIKDQETDNLGVAIDFTFADPLGLIVSMAGIVTAAPGRIDDAAVDFVLAWDPLVVDFGVDGKFELSLETLSFSNAGTKTARATVELLAAPEAQIAAVPEPGSMALVGLAMAGAGIASRRRMA